jgi:hypothetical protein
MKAHQVSEAHLLCTTYYNQRKDQPAPKLNNTETESPILNAMKKLDTLQKEKMSALFNIAYKTAKYGKPYSDFEIDCQLVTKLGVDLGTNYLNAHRCNSSRPYQIQCRM